MSYKTKVFESETDRLRFDIIKRKTRCFMYKLGFIGSGNMGRAMALGAIKNKYASADEIIFYDVNEDNTSKMVQEGISLAESNEEVAEKSAIVILAVKPNLYDEILDDIQPSLTEETLLLSITPSFSIKSLRERLSHKAKIIRAMPNTPALVGEGMMGVCFESDFEEEEKERAFQFLRSFSSVIEVKEEMMVGVGSVSGSAPAFIYMLIEAMADAAVSYGIPRKDAYIFAAQTVKGAAEMVLETGIHPGELKDQVTSPGGTTIAGCLELEKRGFRAAIVEGMKATGKRFKEMEEEAEQ